jgi:hypothetical protein
MTTAAMYQPFSEHYAEVCRLLDYGFQVIPLHGVLPDDVFPDRVPDRNPAAGLRCTCDQPAACDKPGKHTRLDTWKYLNDWTADYRPINKSHIRDWMEEPYPSPYNRRRAHGLRSRYHPQFNPFNWACHNGRSNDNLGMANLDVDIGRGGLETLAAWEAKGMIPRTPREHTPGRGHHIYFAAPDLDVLPFLTKIEIAPGVELKQLGSLINIPPSCHRCGKPQVWDVAPWDAPLVMLPQFAIDLANEIIGEREHRPTSSSGRSGGFSGSYSYTGERPADAVDRARKGVARMTAAVEGQHGHDRLYAVACTLVIFFALSESEAYEILADWNAANAHPPFPERDLRHKLHDATHASGIRGEAYMNDRDRDQQRKPYTDPRFSAHGEFADLAGLDVDGVHVGGTGGNVSFPTCGASGDRTGSPAGDGVLAVASPLPSAPIGTDGAAATGKPLRAARHHCCPHDFAAFDEVLANARTEREALAAAYNEINADYWSSPVCPRPIMLFFVHRCNECGKAMSGPVRCKKRLLCAECRRFYDRRDLINLQTRIAQAVRDGRVIYRIDCTAEAYETIKRTLNNHHARFFRLANPAVPVPDSPTGETEEGWTILADGENIADYRGAVPISEEDCRAAGVRATETDNPKPILGSHEWSLPKKPGKLDENGKKVKPVWKRVFTMNCPEHCTLEVLAAIAVLHSFAVHSFRRGVDEDFMSMQIYDRNPADGSDDVAALFASFSAGEYLPPLEIGEVHCGRSKRPPEDDAKPGMQPATMTDYMGI